MSTPSKEARQAAMTLFLTPSTTDAAEIIDAAFAPLREENERLKKLVSAHIEYEAYLKEAEQMTHGFLLSHGWQYPQELLARGELLRAAIAALNPPKK